MSSLKRMLAVLDVFAPDRPVIAADDVAARLGYSRGTAYRYIRELCAVGLLSRTPAGVTLGPRIIELDWAIRQCDPVLAVAQAAMQALRDRFDCDVLLICYFEARVMVSHHERGAYPMQVSYGRGRAMPLFRGAGSKVLLASLSPQRQRRIFQLHKAEIAEAGMGKDWRGFRATLIELARVGFGVSYAELDAGNVGVGCAIPGGDPNQPNGLVMVFHEPRYAVLDKRLVAEAIRAAAERIGCLLGQ